MDSNDTDYASVFASNVDVDKGGAVAYGVGAMAVVGGEGPKLDSV